MRGMAERLLLSDRHTVFNDTNSVFFRAVICAEFENRFRAVIERLFYNRKTAFIIERLSFMIERQFS